MPVDIQEAEQKDRLDAAMAAAQEEDAKRQQREEEMSKEGQDHVREDTRLYSNGLSSPVVFL